ncbi:MAG: mannosyltransferase family protein [Thermoanaerobaculia bacterium]
MNGLEKLARLLRRLFGPPRLALLVAAWILLLGAWGWVARHHLPIEHRSRWDAQTERRAPLYAKFDAGWYLSIIERGYGPPPREGRPSAHAFFPLYPSVAGVLRDAFAMDGFHAGFVVAYVCLFLAMARFFEEAVERLGESDAWRAVVFFLLFPASFFLASMYAESMFLLFALLAFRDARAGPTGRAALWGVLAGLTRPSALALAPALFLAALERRGPGGATPAGRRWGRAILLGALPAATVFAWIYGVGAVNGEPGLFFRVMEGWRRPASSLAGISDWFLSMKVRAVDQDWREDPTLVLDYGCALLFAVIGAYQLLRRRWADAAWTGSSLALPMTTGVSGGMPRFLMVVYPVYFALAAGSRGKPLARRVWWIVSGALLLAAAARFVNWHWVA